MLVSALAGKDLIMESYQEAIKEDYRCQVYSTQCVLI
jgi:S-adenosylmethionine:tRNA-ribosyltransferase-isomerase (queuine synthetase)